MALLFLFALAPVARAGTITKIKKDHTRFFADLSPSEMEGLKKGATIYLKFDDHPDVVEVKLLKLNKKKHNALFLVADAVDYLAADLAFVIDDPQNEAGEPKDKGSGDEAKDKERERLKDRDKAGAQGDGTALNGQTWSTRSAIASLYATSSTRTELGFEKTSRAELTDGQLEKTSGAIVDLRQAVAFGKKQGGLSLEVGTDTGSTAVSGGGSRKDSQLAASLDVTKALADVAIVGATGSYRTITTKATDANIKGKMASGGVTLGFLKRSALFLVSFTPKAKMKYSGDAAGTEQLSSQLGSVFEVRLADSVYLSMEGAYDLDDAPHAGRQALTLAERGAGRAGLNFLVGSSSCFELGVLRNRSSFPGQAAPEVAIPTLGGFAGLTMRFGSWDVKLGLEDGYGAITHTYKPPADSAAESVTTKQSNHLFDAMLRLGVKY